MSVTEIDRSPDGQVLSNSKLLFLANKEIKEQSSELRYRAPGKYDKQLKLFDVLMPVFPGLVTGYHLGRIIDDIADGDAHLPDGFSSLSELLEKLKEGVRSKIVFPNTGRAGILMSATMVHLGKYSDQLEVEKSVDRFFDSMLAEEERRLNPDKVILLKNDLEYLNKESFESSQDLAFIAIGSPTRSDKIPMLGSAQAKALAIRDLETEVGMGICNIPKEVLDVSGLTFEELQLDPNLLRKNIHLQNWITLEKKQVLEFLHQLEKVKLDTKARILVKWRMGVLKKAIKSAPTA